MYIWCGTGGASVLRTYKKYLSAEAGVLVDGVRMALTASSLKKVPRGARQRGSDSVRT
jgi:hypothetical protein